MIDDSLFNNLPLRGGFTLLRVEFTSEPMVDAIGREAITRTTIIGHQFRVMIRSGATEEELSVTLYHGKSWKR